MWITWLLLTIIILAVLGCMLFIYWRSTSMMMLFLGEITQMTHKPQYQQNVGEQQKKEEWIHCPPGYHPERRLTGNGVQYLCVSD